MKIPNKIILEALLLIALLYVSYYLYRLGINMRADMPIIKGEVVDTDNTLRLVVHLIYWLLAH